MIIAADLLRRGAPWIAIALLSAIILVVGPRLCAKSGRQQAEIRVGHEQGRAATASGRDAVATTGAAAQRERASDELSISNRKEIDHAQGSQVAVGAAVHDAGIDGLCRRAAYRDSERCRLRRAAAR
jgi:hypothetical protein